jgi:ABC-2 type transport system permease protein
MFHRILAIIRKDVTVRFASRSELLFFIILPVIFTAILGGGLAMGGDGDNRVLLPVVDLDATDASAAFIAQLAGSATVRPEVVSPEEGDRLMDDGRPATLTIPIGFGAATQDTPGQTAELRLTVDPANTYSLVVEQAVQAATTALVAPQQVAAAAGQQAAALASLDEAQTAAFLAAARIQATDAMAAAPDLVTARVLGQGSDRAYEAAGQASAGQLITWVIIPLLATAALMAYERTSGTLRRLLVTPSRMATFLLGTLSGQLLMSLVQMALLIGFGVLVMGVNWGSSPAGLIVLLVSFGLAGVAMGTMLGTFTRTDRQAGNLSIMLGMVMALLGGCWWPMEFFPEGVQTAVKVLPTTWAMQGLTDITLRGQGLAGVWPEAAVLLGFAAVFFTLGVWRFRYE